MHVRKFKSPLTSHRFFIDLLTLRKILIIWTVIDVLCRKPIKLFKNLKLKKIVHVLRPVQFLARKKIEDKISGILDTNPFYFTFNVILFLALFSKTFKCCEICNVRMLTSTEE